ncbi:hypothetical protein DVH24_025806 [Malus domestica]|uniref:Uncharacterized protein n=1 Tax=Malus domestica TaxID=3750 RepID=A0A498KE76_MALDO|nr:hypothetical protein DVH24_025806 [Malus domestica]
MGHPSWDCSRANSLNFRVPTEAEASELPKGLVLGRDENIHIRLIGSSSLDDVRSYNLSLKMYHFKDKIENMKEGDESG